MLVFFFKVENVKITLPLIAKDGKDKERETKSGELKILVNGTVERSRRRSAGSIYYLLSLPLPHIFKMICMYQIIHIMYRYEQSTCRILLTTGSFHCRGC